MKLFGKKEQKQNPAGTMMLNMPTVKGSTRDLQSFIKEGYKKNVIINRCIREIVQCIAVCEIEVHKDKKVLETSPTYDLLYRPNPLQSGPQFLRHVFSDYLIGGNMYIASYPENGKPQELWPLDPRYMSVTIGPLGVPSAYIFKQGSEEKRFPVDPITGDCQVFHYKTYNPESPFVGMSPMEAAALPGDAHNAAVLWNYSLLKNGARPSGLLKFKGTPGNDVISKMREFFKNAYQGPQNAGEVPMLFNESDFVKLSETAKDMDYISTLKEFSKYIASVYGVPLPLVDNDASTFNNIEQAKERLWTDTVIPLLDDFLDSFGYWLGRRMKSEGEKLFINLDSVAALEGVRERKYNRMKSMADGGILSIDEAREAIDYTPRGGLADELLVAAGKMPLSFVGDLSVNDQNNLDDQRSMVKTMRELGFDEKTISEALRDGRKGDGKRSD